MNQKARQEATDKVESDFCKLFNNANFGILHLEFCLKIFKRDITMKDN